MTNYLEIPKLGRLRVSVNDQCNLHCLYCHKEGQFTKRNQIEHEEFKELLEYLSQYDVKEVKFSGGEPLLYSKIDDLIKTAKDLNLGKISITTNGLLLEERLLHEIKRAGLDELSISLDSVDPKIFSKLSGGTKSQLEEIQHGINLAKKIGIPEINLNMVLTEYNKDVQSMLNYAFENNLPLRIISFIQLPHPPNNLITDPSETQKLIEELAGERKLSKKKQAYTIYSIGDQTVTLINGLCPDCNQCGKDYAIRLTSDGKLKPCLVSEIGEIDIVAPLREKNEDELHRRIVDAILFKRKGLMKYTPAPYQVLSKPFLTSD